MAEIPELPELLTWIGGVPEASAVEDTFWLDDPNTGEPLQRSRSSSPAQVERAIATAAAVHASHAWSDLAIEERSAHLLRLAAEIAEHEDDIATLDAINSGVPISVTRPTAGSLAPTIARAVELANARGDSESLTAEQGPVALRRVPWGPTAILLPWNAPSAVAVKKLAFALIAGAPVILKPSPFSPWSAQIIARAAQTVGLPEGILSLVLGEGAVGAALASDPRVRAISLTGSTATGRAVAVAAAPNFTRLQLELGSNNPVVVRADADIEETAALLFSGMTKLNGQWCEAPRIVYADRSIYPELLQALEDELATSVVGSSLDDGTTVGPLAYRDRVRQTESIRDAALREPRAEQLVTPEVPGAGSFFPPTVVYGDTVHLETEIFAPLLLVTPTDSDAEAVAKANSGQVGLAAYVFSTDLDGAAKVGASLIAGEVKINGTSLLDMSGESAQSFFGSAGVGGHGDSDLLDFFSGKQVVGVDLLRPPI